MNARPSSQILAAPALYEQVAERLRNRIFAHELPQGGWIDEQALTLEYGISRTPLREALKVLAAEGLVELKPRRGCYVTQLSERDIDEVFPVMAMLEGRVAELAARRATSADFSRLAAIHAELEDHAATHNADRFFEDLFGLVTPDITEILGTKKTDIARQKGDVRGRRFEAAGNFINSLTFAKAQLG